MSITRGVFCSLEGGEGAGKSTQIQLVRDLFNILGISHVDVREPGGTVISEAVRNVLLHTECDCFSPRAELLLYGAARAQIVDEIIEPALARGENVLADRFYDSTTAYQGFGRDLNMGFLSAMKRFATDGLSPDLTIYLDIDPVVGLARATGESADRIEREALDFHQRVRKGYLWIAEKEPDRFKVIDSMGSVEEVHERVKEVLMPLFVAQL